MYCPKCEGTLNINEREGHIGFVCEKCNGMWLSRKYVESIKHNYNFEPSYFIKALSQKQTSTEFKCPSCNTNLHHSTYKNIELEWCSSCNGVWFDNNELNTLVAHYKKEETAGEKLFVGIELLALFFSS